MKAHIEQAKKIIAGAIGQFAGYAQHHAAKGTPEGLAKADVNLDFAKQLKTADVNLNAALRQYEQMRQEDRDTRDFFAGAALIGLLSGAHGKGDIAVKALIEDVFVIANKMMEGRKE